MASHKQMLDALLIAADREGTEIGEFWHDLASLGLHLEGLASDEFIDAYKEEIKAQYLEMKAHYREVVEVVTPEPYTRTRLEYIGE